MNELEEGMSSYQGFHSSFRAIQGCLPLNTDVSTKAVIKPGPVLNFLVQNQKVDTRLHPYDFVHEFELFYFILGQEDS
ncbi:hypothetical protein Prudu_005621 [Prunus dulcis]|uniref:Argonaute linker 1 domain-containing protein n=1 Tax=Prunus dulcis TaxID=3755 RepID=A0A4Y1QY02_PRUDU|nr:hypothetical protein Prudu_005621 [Prunus dulcis]